MPELPPWPNLFVVGAPRTATTSLWAAMSEHPDIFMPRMKEPHYFTRMWPRIVPTVKREPDYRALFADAGDVRYRGEASPSYLTDPIAAPEIRKVSPDARIIISLRDPVARAYSQYWHLARYGTEQPSFLEVVRRHLSEIHPYWETPLVHTGEYVEPVRRYLDLFGDHVHVMFYEEYAEDARRELRKIFEFLGVDTAPAATVPTEQRNPGQLPRNPAMRRLYSMRRTRRVIGGLVPRRLHGRVERAALRPQRPPEMEPEARRLLGELYDPEREELARLLGRPLPWGPSTG
jgi:hypothetical protein